MSANPKTLEYLQRGVTNLIEHGSFRNGSAFRPTQYDALLAYHNFLFGNELSPEETLQGFFELPTGIGKTALFLSILDEAHRVARAESDHLRAMIVVPSVSLLEQMKGNDREKGDIEKWAPDYLDTVGFYGGNYRELGHELTVIIYNSWVKLMEEGVISSSNSDIVISDEAHRGTSERRIQNKFNAFSNGTAQIAFTATARFDEEKSVEQSHGTEIFARSLPDAVRLDELAAYIQTQLHIIRVVPPEKKEEFDEAADPKSGMRAGMRQEAWMRNMVKLFRDGRDEITGDLLSDNKAGFYIADTAMADRTANLLNADPELSRLAIERGCKAVAVSIHSGMKDKEARMTAFKRGEYMACASDSMMKEGFDDPVLKNVFDYPRSSLVDKAQIIGRAARKWFNEVKGRYEGATIIDTIVYIGSNDPQEDGRLKEDAIRKAIMAWSVLESTALFSEKEEEEIIRNRKSGIGGFGSPVLGMDVESFVTLEEVQAIHARQQELLEDNKIPLTDKMLNTLLLEKKRTGLAPWALLQLADENVFDLNPSTVSHWFSGDRRVDQKHYQFIIDLYGQQPNESDLYINIDKKIVERLQYFSDNTCIGLKQLIQNSDNVPPDLDYGRTFHIVKGTVKKASKAHVDFLLSEWKKYPIIGKMVDVTEELSEKIKSEVERTGIKYTQLAKIIPGVPEGFKRDTVQWLINRTVKQVRPDVLEWVVKGYASLPDAGFEVIKVDQPIIDQFNMLAKRTQVSPDKLMTLKGVEMPAGVTAALIRGVMRGRTQTIRKDFLSAITKIWSDLPDLSEVAKIEMIKVTDHLIESITSRIEKTGKGLYVLLKAQNDVPDGLTPSFLSSMRGGNKKTIRKDHLDYIIKKYDELISPTNTSSAKVLLN